MAGAVSQSPQSSVWKMDIFLILCIYLKNSPSQNFQFENVLGISQVENHPSCLFPSLAAAEGVPELACLSLSTFLGYHILSQVAFLPVLGVFPST